MTRYKRPMFAVTILLGLLAVPLRANPTPAPVVTSLFVPIEGNVAVMSEDGTQTIDTVRLSGEVHLVTQVRIANGMSSANIYANLVRVRGTSDATGLVYLGVGAGVVETPPDPIVPPDPIIPQQVFELGLVRLQGTPPDPITPPSPIRSVLPVYLSGFQLDETGKLLAVSASFRNPTF